MSYSRWSNSAWYTFYNASSSEFREEQVLSLWYSMNTCYDWTYEKLLDFTPEFLIKEYECSSDEASEAMEYIGFFLEEVGEEFPLIH